LKDPGVDGRIILKWIFERSDGGIPWIDMVHDKDRWWALVNTVTFGFHKIRGIS
jgi:hypothetical protein